MMHLFPSRALSIPLQTSYHSHHVYSSPSNDPRSQYVTQHASDFKQTRPPATKSYIPKYTAGSTRNTGLTDVTPLGNSLATTLVIKPFASAPPITALQVSKDFIVNRPLYTSGYETNHHTINSPQQRRLKTADATSTKKKKNFSDKASRVRPQTASLQSNLKKCENGYTTNVLSYFPPTQQQTYDSTYKRATVSSTLEQQQQFSLLLKTSSAAAITPIRVQYTDETDRNGFVNNNKYSSPIGDEYMKQTWATETKMSISPAAIVSSKLAFYNINKIVPWKNGGSGFAKNDSGMISTARSVPTTRVATPRKEMRARVSVLTQRYRSRSIEDDYTSPLIHTEPKPTHPTVIRQIHVQSTSETKAYGNWFMPAISAATKAVAK